MQIEVIPIDVRIPADPGAPLPVILKDEWQTFILFRLLQLAPEEPRTGIIEFIHCWSIVDTGYDEESLWLHPLYGSGLAEAGFFSEVKNSSWPRQFDRPPGSNSPFGGNDGSLRHFVLTFHDSTIEVLTRDLQYQSDTRDIFEVIPEYASRLLQHER